MGNIVQAPGRALEGAEAHFSKPQAVPDRRGGRTMTRERVSGYHIFFTDGSKIACGVSAVGDTCNSGSMPTANPKGNITILAGSQAAINTSHSIMTSSKLFEWRHRQ